MAGHDIFSDLHTGGGKGEIVSEVHDVIGKERWMKCDSSPVDHVLSSGLIEAGRHGSIFSLLVKLFIVSIIISFHSFNVPFGIFLKYWVGFNNNGILISHLWHSWHGWNPVHHTLNLWVSSGNGNCGNSSEFHF